MDPREWLFDKRVLRRNLEKNVVSAKALKEYIADLPDLSDEIAGLEADSEGEEAAAEGDE